MPITTIDSHPNENAIARPATMGSNKKPQLPCSVGRAIFFAFIFGPAGVALLDIALNCPYLAYTRKRMMAEDAGILHAGSVAH